MELSSCGAVGLWLSIGMALGAPACLIGRAAQAEKWRIAAGGGLVLVSTAYIMTWADDSCANILVCAIAFLIVTINEAIDELLPRFDALVLLSYSISFWAAWGPSLLRSGTAY